MSMHDLNTSPSRQSYVQPDHDVTTSDYESYVDNRRNGYGEQVFGSDNQTGTVFIRISVPELRIQKCLQFELDETVWQAKQRVLATFAKDLKDSINYGLYCPPMNGRAGKFLDEERLLREYPLQGPIGFLEFKYKKRVYKMMHVNPRKLKQLHVKGNLRHFLDYVKTCNVEKVTKLTNKGLDPNFHDSISGETPLSIAVMQTKQKSKELILSLTGGGAHLDFRNRHGMTPLHKAVLIGNIDAVKTLLDLGVSPNLKDARSLTPLYYCVANGGSPVLTEMLLQERAAIGAQDEQGWAEIHQACRQGLVQHLEHLLYYGADLNQQNASGNTALHVCALNNKESCARVLLFRGASKDILNFSNQDAYQVAIISGNNDLAEIIQNHNPRDAVPFREPPKYSNRRQDSVATAAMFALSRSRSDPKLNLIMHERFITPSSSSQSLRSHTSRTTDSESCSPSRGGYETDSPCSMSISSTSSGPGYGFTYGYPPGYGFNSVRHKLSDHPRLPPHFYRHSMYNGVNNTYNGVNSRYNGVKSHNDVVCQRHSMYEGLNSYNDVMSQRLNIYGMKSKVQASRSLSLQEGQNVQIGFQSYRSSFECTSPRQKVQHRMSLFEHVNGNPYYNECQQNSTSQYNEPCQYSTLPEKLYICVKPHIPVYARDLHLKQGDIVEVLHGGEQAFWEGRANGQEGWFPSENVQEFTLTRRAGSVGDLLRETRDAMLNRNTLAALIQPGFGDYAPRTVVLQRGPEGYGFVLRGAKSQSKTAAELDFHPTPEFPALQYLDSVDPGSKADRAGLKGGDFILEINGENVVRASHDRVVQIIRQSGDTLALKVVTVKPMSKPDHWLQHQDGSMTLPSRASKKPAPQPPQRDPQTSLSVSKADGKHIAEGMAELDELDLALAQYESQEVPVVTSDQKTASIRAKHSAKRVSCVELENIVTDDIQKGKDYMSPSEMRIKKYHKKQNGGMERANSNPDLLSDRKRSEPVYATPGGNVKSEHKRSGSIGDTSRHTYAIPGELPNGDNISLRSSISSGSGSRLQSPSTERPKGAPPAPPNGNSIPKRPAPQPPPGVDPIAPAKTELISISTNRKSVNVTEIKVNSSTKDSEYESSFRPGISAHLTNEPKVVTASVEQAKLKSHSRNTSVGSNKSSESQSSSKASAPVDQDKPSVSFAEDKVYDSAKSFLQKHPNAQLLVTADIHADTLKNKRKSTSYEPEPDYDDNDNDKLDSNKTVTQTKNSVTVISVGDTSAPKTTSKHQYTISRSDIPTAKSGEDIVIPPPPSEPAPKPPSPKLNTSRPPSPKLTRTANQEERRSSIDISPKTTPAPPPPAPPPPPVAPPPPSVEQKVDEVKPMASLVAKGLPTEDILAAVAQRKARMDTGDIRMSEQPEKAKTTETWKKKFDETHNALLAAVAKRRSVLATTDENAVVDKIESKLQKTKKLQAVKMYFGSDTTDKKETEKKDEEKKSENKSSSASKGATPVKIDIAPATSIKKTEPVKTPVKTGVTPLKIEIASASSAKPNNTSTNVRKVSEDKTKTSTENKNISNVKSSTQQKSMTIKTPDKTANENKESSSTTTTNAQEKSTDFVAMAEKARQEWLQKKASTSSLKINTTSSNGVSSKSPKSPPVSQSTSKMNGTVMPTKSVTSITSISTKSTSSTKTSTQQLDKKSENKGLTPMKSDRDSDVISKTKSIRDRIKNFEKTDSDPNGNLKSPGSSLSSSPDRKKSSTVPPPPPGFGDAVHIDIIPPPSGFNYDEGKHSGDSESVVSSVSTLSTLSDEHGDSGFGRQKHSYEDLIPPPPPGFDDNSDQSYDVIPSVIPPPPEFGGSSINNISKPARTNKPFLSKPVDNWQCLDVLDWLDSLNMTQYKDSFQKHCINGKKLMGLTRNDYIELGVTQVGHRMNLERSIKKAAIRRNSGVES